MKTTLDGVVFFVAARVKSCKNGVSPQADFPRTEGRARKRHAPSGRILPNPDGGAAGRGGRTGRQNRAAEQGGKTDRQDGAARRIGRTERQDGSAGRGGKTERQDGAAGRGSKMGGRTRRKDRAAGRGGRKRGGGRVIAADRSGGAARTNKKRARPSVPPVLAPGFQPPEAAGQRKSARRSGPASAKGQRTGSQYAVRTPGRVQYYPHGRR